MNRALREATTSSPVLMPQSATNHLNEIFNYLGINVPIASELGLMTLPNIRGYAGNDIEDIINMFSKTDLNKADFTDTIIRLRAVGKTMEAILSTNILVLSTNVITEAQRSAVLPIVDIRHLLPTIYRLSSVFLDLRLIHSLLSFPNRFSRTRANHRTNLNTVHRLAMSPSLNRNKPASSLCPRLVHTH